MNTPPEIQQALIQEFHSFCKKNSLAIKFKSRFGRVYFSPSLDRSEFQLQFEAMQTFMSLGPDYYVFDGKAHAFHYNSSCDIFISENKSLEFFAQTVEHLRKENEVLKSQRAGALYLAGLFFVITTVTLAVIFSSAFGWPSEVVTGSYFFGIAITVIYGFIYFKDYSDVIKKQRQPWEKKLNDLREIATPGNLSYMKLSSLEEKADNLPYCAQAIINSEQPQLQALTKTRSDSAYLILQKFGTIGYTYLVWVMMHYEVEPEEYQKLEDIIMKSLDFMYPDFRSDFDQLNGIIQEHLNAKDNRKANIEILAGVVSQWVLWRSGIYDNMSAMPKKDDLTFRFLKELFYKEVRGYWFKISDI